MDDLRTNTTISASTQSFKAISEEVEDKNNAKKITLLSFLTLFLLVCIGMVLYYPFTLIRERNLSLIIDDNSYLTKSDVINLSGFNKTSSYVFLNEAKVKDKLQTTAPGIIKNVSFKNDSFFPMIAIEERFPLCKINDVCFTSPNIITDTTIKYPMVNECLENISNIEQLSIDRRNELKDKFNADIDNSIIIKYPNSDFITTEDDYKELSQEEKDKLAKICDNSIHPLIHLKKSAVNYIEYINYNSDIDYEINKKADVILYDYNNSKHYVFKKCDITNFDILFANKNFPYSVLKDLNKRSSDSNISTTSYHKNEINIDSCYLVEPTIDDISKEVIYNLK